MSEVVELELSNEPVVTNSNVAIFSPRNLRAIQEFANVMASGKATVPKHLAGSQADCMAVTMQAVQWGMNPFAVAQKTHLINGTLGYEAQLVNAVIVSSGAVLGRFKYRYGGNWDKFTGSAKDNKTNEAGLFIEVGAQIKGEPEITWGEPVYLQDVKIRNSPLWSTQPKQQLAYLAVKYWARLYCPEVILGVYTPDELEDEKRAIKNVTPVATVSDVNNLISDNADKDEKKIETRAPDEILNDFTRAIAKINSCEELEKAYSYAQRTLNGHEEQLDKAGDVYEIRKSELEK